MLDKFQQYIEKYDNLVKKIIKSLREVFTNELKHTFQVSKLQQFKKAKLPGSIDFDIETVGKISIRDDQ